MKKTISEIRDEIATLNVQIRTAKKLGDKRLLKAAKRAKRRREKEIGSRR